MEVCMPRLLSHAPLPLRRPAPSHPFASSPPSPAFPPARIGARTTLSLFPKSVEQHKSETFAARSSTSEDISASILDGEPGKVVVTGETEAAEEVDESPKKYETPVPAVEVTPSEEEPTKSQFQPFQLFDDFNLELKQEDIYPILLYGGGSLLTLWISFAITGAIDSIPLIPKMLEVVGLGYTVWFSYRYLIFKKNRDELVAKIEELKQEIIGGSEDV